MNSTSLSQIFRRIARSALVACAVAVIAVSASSAAAPDSSPAVSQASDPCNITAPGRIVAVGDVHGAFDAYVGILQAAGLIDDDNDWIGGNATLVQLGDTVDRGLDSPKVLELIERLQNQADDDGGRVYFLLGNHEVMRLTGALQDVNPEEYEFHRGPQASPLRESFYEIVSENRRAAARAAGEDFDDRAFRTQFIEETPLGLVELLQAFDTEGKYGRFLRRQDVMVRINGMLFVHGGISPVLAVNGCELIASAALDEVKANWGEPGMTLLTRGDGPLWYRGLVEEGAVSQADVDGLLQAMGASGIVVGHTGTEDHRIQARFDNKVFALDTGMLGGDVYPGGVASALEIAGGNVTAIYGAGEREILVGSSVTGK